MRWAAHSWPFWGAGRECNLSKVRASLTSHRHSQQSTPGVHAWDEGEECEEDSLGGGCLLGVELECYSRKEETAEHTQSHGGVTWGYISAFLPFSISFLAKKKVRSPDDKKYTRKRERDACIAPAAPSWGFQPRRSLLPTAGRRFLCLRALARVKKIRECIPFGGVVGC